MVGQWGIPGWNFCHYCCVPAHKNLFSRGGGGVCNYLLDHGHLQVHLWLVDLQMGHPGSPYLVKELFTMFNMNHIALK